MENMETVNPPQEEALQPERVERVARCIECSNEWIATNGNEPKPSRCPVCMSRDVKWRDECTGEEISKKDVKKTLKKATKPKSKRAPPKRNPDGSFAKSAVVSSVTTTGSPVSNLPAEATSTHSIQQIQQRPPEPDYEEEDGEEEEFTYEDAKAAIPRIPMQTIVLLLGAAAVVCGILFLIRKSKERNLIRREAHKEEAPEAPRRPTPMPTFNFGGNLA